MSRSQKPRVLIVGVGALGSLYAARLSAVAEVVMWGHWPAQLSAIQSDGLTVEDLDGRRRQVTLSVISDPDQVERPFALALVLVKSHQTAYAAARLPLMMAADGVIMTLQNGLGNRESLAAKWTPERVLVGTTSEGATMVGPGVVRHAGAGETFVEDSEPARPWIDLLARAGVPVETRPTVDDIVWRKLAINAGINPLTALVGKPNGYLAANRWAREMSEAAARETAAVARAVGVDLAGDEAAETVTAVADRTRKNQSSMWQDVRRQAPTEIEAITGQIVAHAEQHGVAVLPTNRLLLMEMREYERRRHRWRPVGIGQLHAAWSQVA